MSNKQRDTPREIAVSAWDRGHITTFAEAFFELMMCSDPTPLSKDAHADLVRGADRMAKQLGFSDWVEGYHGLCFKSNREVSKNKEKA
jgi:hypothetical protein